MPWLTIPPRPRPRPLADTGGWRVLATIALAALAAALMVFGDREPMARTELHCFPLTQARSLHVGASGPAEAAGPLPVAASWAIASCGKLALADESFAGPAGAR
jgi:hypothetical protein